MNFFAITLENISDQSFDDRRMRILSRFTEHSQERISAEQMLCVIREFTFDDGKVGAFKAVLPHVDGLDWETIIRVIEMLNFDGERFDIVSAFIERRNQYAIASDELLRLLQLFSHDDGRVHVLAMVAAHARQFGGVAKEALMATLVHNTSRERAARYLDIAQPEPQPRRTDRVSHSVGGGGAGFNMTVNGLPVFSRPGGVSGNGSFRVSNGRLFISNVEWKVHDGMWYPPDEIAHRQQAVRQPPEFDMNSLLGTDRPAHAGATNECVVCTENEKRVALVPCGHRCLCIACSKQLAMPYACPVCRAAIVSAVVVFD